MAAVFMLPYYLLQSYRRGKYRDGIAERFGHYRESLLLALKGVPFIWVHAVSVGETRAAIPLIKALRKRYPDHKILVSNVTETGHQIASSSQWIDHTIYFPFDFPWVIRRVFSQLKPEMIVIVETELWPNFIRYAHDEGFSLALVNGRISDRSYPRYRKFRFLFLQLLKRFSVFCMQSQTDSERIVALGADREKVENTGNLKYDYELKTLSDDKAAEKKAGYRVPESARIIVAGSTHEGEEEQLLEVYRRLRESGMTELFMILIPRHPERCSQLQDLLRERGFAYRLRSQTESQAVSQQSGEVLLVDTLGEVIDCYSISDLVFVGGSLVKVGGHNMLEASLVSKPVLFGAHTHNFKVISAKMIRAGAGIRVADKNDLYEQCRLLLSEPSRARIMGQAGQALIVENSGSSERTMRHIVKML